MDKYEAAMAVLLDYMNSQKKSDDEYNIPVGVSNRHIHLSKADLNILFGEEYSLKKIKDLSQPGQYACKEVLVICGPKGAIEKVRVLGPVREKTQIEILKADAYKLGINPQIRDSGDLENTCGLTLVGPRGSISLDEGVIIAKRHIHMTSQDAKDLNVSDGEIVSIEVDGLRGGTYKNVTIRANDNSALECHLDIEEANAMMIDNNSKIKIVK